MLATVTFLALLGQAAGQSAITVEANSPQQVIDGFGFSEAFDRAAGIQGLSSTLQKEALDYLFSTSMGAGLTILRNRIGSNGTGDSIEPTSLGSPDAKATYVWDDNDEGQVWFSQQALSYGVTTIYADAWSAPGFMKTNGDDCCGGYLCGTTSHTCASGDWRQAYANYLVEYIKLYASAGINITHLGFLNEPDYTASYSSMLSGASEAASFIPILYETVQNAGLDSQITLTCCDAEGWQSQVSITQGLMADDMQEYLGVITAHSYTSMPDSLMPTTLKVWGTEAADLNDAWCTTWYSSGGACEGLTWAGYIATGLVEANLSAYLYWEGAEYNTNASSYLVLVQDSGAIPSGRLWAFAHWSRFVRPGAYRVSTTGSIGNVQTSAFKNADGSIIVVFINSGSTAESAAIGFSGFAPATAVIYTTDNGATLAESTGTLMNGAVTVSLPGHSAVTVKLTGSSGGMTTTTTAVITTTKTTTTTANSATGCTATEYAQCGGIGYQGCAVCATPYTCQQLNPYYYQCLAA